MEDFKLRGSVRSIVKSLDLVM